MRRLLPFALLLLMLATGCSRHPQFLERRVRVGAHDYRYRVWLPPHYSRFKRWPVVLFLHGSGERGDDDARQLAMGLPAALQRNPERYPFVVVIPQCAFNHEWYGEMETYALAALDRSIAEFHGDRARVTLTGMSMGGAGAWYMARLPGRFAAVVPVCGEVVRAPDDPFPDGPPPALAPIFAAPDPFATLAKLIGSTPVWAFHGAEDNVIPAFQSRHMIATLRAAGNRALYTEYAGIGHDSWDLAYIDPALPKWMLAQRLPSSRAPRVKRH